MPKVESLTGYVKRLAEAHNLSPKTLDLEEIKPFIAARNESEASGMPQNFKGSSFHMIDGMTNVAEQYLQALQQLTSRKTLRALTLLNLHQVLPHNTTLRKYQAWCPRCYAEQFTEIQIVYDPLIWSIEAVSVCAEHNTALSTRCPICKKQQPALRRPSRVGYCCYCHTWLGVDDVQTPEVHQRNEDDWIFQMWKTQVVGELIAATTSESYPLSRSDFQSALQMLVTECTCGNTRELARWWNVDETKLRNWCEGRHVPSFSSLLNMCYRTNLSPFTLLTCQPNLIPDFQLHIEQQQSEIAHVVLSPKSLFCPEEVQRIFQDAFEEEPPPSMRTVLQRIGQTRGTMLRHFKVECETIVKRHQEWIDSNEGNRTLKQRKNRSIATDSAIICRLIEATKEEPPVSLAKVAVELRCNPHILKKWHPIQCDIILKRYRDARCKDWETIKTKLQDALAIHTPPFPSLAEVARPLRVLPVTIQYHFPEECREISRKYRNQYSSTIQQELEKALHEYPPPSFSEVTRRCGRSNSTLNYHCPELCIQVVERYAAYVKLQAQQLELTQQEEIRQAVMRVHEEGGYPSLRQIQAHLSQPAMMLRSMCMDTWRTILCELGYRDHPNESPRDSEHEE
jgi:hypothetical protein